jgi:hypothetical protein
MLVESARHNILSSVGATLMLSLLQSSAHIYVATFGSNDVRCLAISTYAACKTLSVRFPGGMCAIRCTDNLP